MRGPRAGEDERTGVSRESGLDLRRVGVVGAQDADRQPGEILEDVGVLRQFPGGAAGDDHDRAGGLF